MVMHCENFILLKNTLVRGNFDVSQIQNNIRFVSASVIYTPIVEWTV